MSREPINLDISKLPIQLHKYFVDGAVIDCSCSQRAKTYYLPKSPGYYLKIGAVNSLAEQALIGGYFAKKGFTAPVLEYFSDATTDYMLMVEVKGVDGTNETILAQPERFCDIFSESLRALHETDCTGCPIVGVTSSLMSQAHEIYNAGKSDPWMLEYADIKSVDEGYRILCENAHILREDTHIHGDACVPNIIIDDWKFAGFIDFEGGGIGDRHFDILWAIWSLGYNTKTDKYKERFIDGYGRDAFDMERFKLCTAIQAFAYEKNDVRKATADDISRISEILIFAKRTAYRSIFRNDQVSFSEMQVLPLAMNYVNNPQLLDDIIVYDDEFVKGMAEIKQSADTLEIVQLYVDPFFQHCGIGGELLSEIERRDVNNITLWVLEKNINAKKFYEKHGFHATGEKCLEDGTTEYLLKYMKEV